MVLNIFKNVDELNAALAEKINEFSNEAIQARGQFNFVLSGGNSPRKFYELLASEPYRSRLDWDQFYFFFGDERFVPAEDPQRNSLMAAEVLFKPLNIKANHIFEVNTQFSPEEAAKNYWETISKHFNGKEVKFDFSLLGLGDNSHTASLFPYTPVLTESEATIQSLFVREVNQYRITMTAPLINLSRHIAFLVFGKGKAEAVYHVLQDQSSSAKQYPARLISTDEEKVQWFLDGDAASELKEV